MFEFLSDPYILGFFLVFIVFIVVAYKLFKFLAKAFIIGLLASLFPIAGSLLFGLDIQISLTNMIWFGITGILLFFLYSLIRTGWKFLKIVTKPFRWLLKPRRKRESAK